MEEKLKALRQFNEAEGKKSVTNGAKAVAANKAQASTGSKWRSANKDEGLRGYGDVVMNRLVKGGTKPPAHAAARSTHTKLPTASTTPAPVSQSMDFAPQVS